MPQKVWTIRGRRFPNVPVGDAYDGEQLTCASLRWNVRPTAWGGEDHGMLPPVITFVVT